MEKVVFLDIDGTLVTKYNSIPESAKQAIQDLKKNNILPVISTGRAPLLIEEVRNELGIDSYIAMNGQLVVHEGEVVYHNPIEKETVDKLIAHAVENNDGIILCGAKDIFSNSIVSLAKRSSVLTLLKGIAKLIPGSIKYSFLSRLIKKPPKPEEYEGKPIYQVIIETSMEEEQHYKHLFQDLHFARSNYYTVDIISKGISKATGIEHYLNHVGLKRENTYAFGDSPNDLEMLAYVETSVAMGNGWDNVKAVADYVTDDVDKDGIKNALEYFGLI
ncbi:Cof-type HAD-IIB family hydrolase [Alkalibacterium kapii]|uniref:Phosphatase n=1 Tax=Alkalibacterium kapii TaxID=426704 RepID=A0A511AWD9_9LACT|nr:Cof-type HAD-IIB family hydrolase [Alkalibacterium kapii]GEK91643.1 phosphatase [Alkalibacterium kapii]